MPSAEYYTKQAEIASRLALTESDPVKMRELHLLALQMFEKAERAKAEGRKHQTQHKKEIRRPELS
ncbi:hypothetical protein [Bradyrhizobium sp. 6(2017)]|uniref:hypothetical protein n=1 Tax=Bradyrhizobium sp. 6(2017) TaxID=1197460 RepID=UPI0013E176B7|nr:hypothetical protein [Bradyrhizobium sp. 6(2017)]QIG94414.1 hypothetical protein G6P99_19330 [Bradyrhizobium sp. 6(2017)]